MNHHCRFLCIHCSFISDSFGIWCRFIYTVEGQHHMCSESRPHALLVALQDSHCTEQCCLWRKPWDLKNSSKAAQPKKASQAEHPEITVAFWPHWNANPLSEDIWVKQKEHHEKYEKSMVGTNYLEVIGTSQKVTGDFKYLRLWVADFEMHARNSCQRNHTFG